MRCPRCLALPPLTDAIRAKTGWLQSSCPRKLYVCLMSGLSIRMIIALDRAGRGRVLWTCQPEKDLGSLPGLPAPVLGMVALVKGGRVGKEGGLAKEG